MNSQNSENLSLRVLRVQLQVTLTGMGGGVCAVYRENAREMKLGNLGGGFQVEKTPEWGGGARSPVKIRSPISPMRFESTRAGRGSR